METKQVLDALGITREDVIERTAQVLADQTYDSEESVYDAAMTLIRERVDKVFNDRAAAAIDTILREAGEGIMRRIIQPVDMWGDKTGPEKTFAELFSDKAANFWSTKVKEDGAPSTSYGAKSRAEWMARKVIGDEFEKAVKQHFTDIAGALKDAMRDDLQERIDEHLCKIIKVKSARDQGKWKGDQ